MVKPYDLEARIEEFAKNIIKLCKELPKNTVNFELISQVVRAGGSVGANYIEANEALSKKDFYYRVRICRKEAKESAYWLRLILSANTEFKAKIEPLIQEAVELMKIFGAIVRKGP